MTYASILEKVSEELNIPLEVVKLAYESYWKFIRESIKSLPLGEDLSEEDFSKLKTNFNIPSLGKLSCTYDRMVGVKKRYEYLCKLRESRLYDYSKKS
jgi:hypothetical protein|uniref:Histone family protein DNA-binding protein, Burkholderia ambifaria, Histone family.85A n=1 Tax=virus sp. ctPYc18 TaxID=2828251 RepID=A0A8S5RC72_9VIRU|nr:MAG TPA: Histone family protein DNA-binding protein, Burkholderia ambifaria, Histone family.85A [virus sp. ctPYc18]